MDLKLPESVTNIGWVGERKAVALLALGFFASVFALMAMIAAAQIPELVALFAGLGVCYGIGFFALAADWFWARWFAQGLGYSGLTMVIFSVITTKELGAPMIVVGVAHALIAFSLLGPKMSAVFEGRTDWRTRWNLDDNGVLKVQRAVTRAASSLPSLIMFIFAPREGATALLTLGTLGVLGMVGLLKGRTWGLLVLGATGVATIATSIAMPPSFAAQAAAAPIPLSMLGYISGGLLLAATLPFVPRMLSYVSSRRVA